MSGITTIELFILASILLNLTPGPDTFYIIGRTLSQGYGAGIASALGISSGCIVHTLAAAVGLSAILTTSATAFMAVKLTGAFYLIYLGCKQIWSAGQNPDADITSLKKESLKRIYFQGVITNVLNPKVALFFLSFLPQFVSPDVKNSMTPFLILGFTFITTGTIWCLLLASMASGVSGFFSKKRSRMKIINRLTGSLFILLGIRLATSNAG